jgi:hypothetical protein
MWRLSDGWGPGLAYVWDGGCEDGRREGPMLGAVDTRRGGRRFLPGIELEQALWRTVSAARRPLQVRNPRGCFDDQYTAGG